MSYQKLEEHENHYVFHHDNGHEVRIAKKGLSESTLKKIQGFAKGGEISQEEADKFNQGWMSQSIKKPKGMAEGGEVKQDEIKLNPELAKFPLETEVPKTNYEMQSTPVEASAAPSPSMMGATWDFAKDIGSKAFNTLKDFSTPGVGVSKALENVLPTPEANPNVQQVAMTEQPQLPQPQGPQNIPLETKGPAQVSPLLMGTGQQYEKAFESQKGALEQQAKAEGQLGLEQASVYQQQQDMQQRLLEDYQNRLATNELERAALKDDIKSNQLDARRVFSDMSAGQRFMSGIAMVLGGFGAGATGGRNMALEQLNKFIDNDINEQKANLGTKENLLATNLKEEGNLRDAMTTTKLQLMTIAQAQLEKNMALAKTPQAQAAAQMALSKLEMDMAPIREQMLMKKTMLNAMNQPGSGGVSPEMYIRAVVPEKEREEALKELKALQVMQKSGTNALDSWDKVNKMLIGGFFSPHEKEALIKPIIAQLSKETAGRFTETDAAFLESLFPKPGDFEKTRKTKREKLQNLIQEKMSSPLLVSLGVPIPKFSNAKQMSVGQGYVQAGYKK